MCLCVFVCLCVFFLVCVCVYIYMSVCLCLSRVLFLRVCVCVYVSICLCVCLVCVRVSCVTTSRATMRAHKYWHIHIEDTFNQLSPTTGNRQCYPPFMHMECDNVTCNKWK